MAAEIHTLERRVPQRTRSEAGTHQPAANPVQYPAGASRQARAVREQIAQVARFSTTVLILGESGTGKELVARQIHSHSARGQGPFVPINCGAIPADLLESELFGHERGAFTGAIQARPGRFEIAEGGTLFLDEIGEMSPHMQVKLLRVLQHKSFERVGSGETRSADVRIVAATHRDLEEEVRAGRFREDLFFRLNVFPIQMPALRDRPQDLQMLIEAFHIQLQEQGHIPSKVTPAALEALKRYEWPGNVRELQNLLERLSVLLPDETVGVNELPERYRSETGVSTDVLVERFEAEMQDTLVTAGAAPSNLPPRFELPTNGLSLKDVLTGVERDLVQQALARSSGVVSQAARLLGLGRTTLLEKIRKLNLAETYRA